MSLAALKTALNAGNVELVLELQQDGLPVYLVRTKPVVAPAPAPAPAPTPVPVPTTTGFRVFVNVGEGGFSPQVEPGTIDQNYTYPDNAYLDSLLALAPFAGVRIAFLWTRLQPTLGGALTAADLTHLKRMVTAITAKGKVAILDSHDYGRRGNNGQVIEGALADQYADYWFKIATEFKANDLVWYNHNEPHDQGIAGVVTANQKMVDAIRRAGAKGKILLPGTGWTGAWVWATQSGPAYVSTPIRDPLNNFAFDMHQYFDGNSSGTSGEVAPDAATRLDAAIAWCKQNGQKMFLGEFAFADTPAGHTAATTVLTKLRDSGVCEGAAYWAAGPWWPADWNIIGPGKGNGQLTTLKKFM